MKKKTAIITGGAQKIGKILSLNFIKADHLQHTAGRLGKAEDNASMTLFPAYPENGFFTGQNFIAVSWMTRKMIYV